MSSDKKHQHQTHAKPVYHILVYSIAELFTLSRLMVETSRNSWLDVEPHDDALGVRFSPDNDAELSMLHVSGLTYSS